MIVQKVRGENKLKPVKIFEAEYKLAMRLGVPIEEFVKQYIDTIAKQRRWKWWFEQTRGKK